MKICEMCSNIHDGSYASGRFCSSFCARKFSSFSKRKEINKKVSATLKSKIKSGELVYVKNTYKLKCPICKKDFSSYNKNKIYCSRQCYNSDSHQSFRKISKGGYREGSGRGKCGYYKGIYCQSTYELAYVIYNIDHNIIFKRNDKRFKYVKDGKERTYLPDFIEGEYIIEIKGYYTTDVDLKAKCVNQKIKVLYLKDLKYAFDYVYLKYGRKDIQSLYDDYKPRFSYTCGFCKRTFTSNKKKATYCNIICSGKAMAQKKHNLSLDNIPLPLL